MRIVLASPYFPPDTPPYAAMVQALARKFAEDGHCVTVLTCQPTYNRRLERRVAPREVVGNTLEIRRRWALPEHRRIGAGRLINVVLFTGSVIGARRWIHQADIVVAVSTPPVVLGMSGLALARTCRAKFVYHKQDIHPDVASAVGLAKSMVLTKFLRRLDSWTDRHSDRIVVLSKDMASTEVARGVHADRLAVINNFDPWEEPHESGVPAALPAQREAGFLRVVFAGNLGRFQGLSSLLRAADALRSDERIHFDMVGDGALRADLEREAKRLTLKNVTFHGYMPPTNVAALLRAGEVIGVVSLERGVIRTAYPSKTLTYLRNGCPVLAMVEADSELAEELHGAGAGVAVPPGDWRAMADAILDLRGDPSAMASMRVAASSLYAARFSEKSNLHQWATLVNGL